jgi:hypothetical protein
MANGNSNLYGPALHPAALLLCGIPAMTPPTGRKRGKRPAGAIWLTSAELAEKYCVSVEVIQAIGPYRMDAMTEIGRELMCHFARINAKNCANDPTASRLDAYKGKRALRKVPQPARKSAESVKTSRVDAMLDLARRIDAA